MEALFGIASLLAALVIALRELKWIRGHWARTQTSREWGARRREVLAARPPETHGGEDKPYGMLVEAGMGATVLSLTAFAEGEASLFSNSGGDPLIAPPEAGSEVRLAARALVEGASEETSLLVPVHDCPRPLNGNVRFTLITARGWLAAEENEEALEKGWSPLSPLYQRSAAVRRLLQAPHAA